MERIWAPWRKEYIEQGTPGGCIFCDLPRGGDDRATRIVTRAKTCFSILNRFPYNGGHIMVAPFRHTAQLKDLEVGELTDLMVLVRDSISLLEEKLEPGGFNVGINMGRIAGAGVDTHIHVHIVPRWNGDTNFMPVLTETRVISQALDEMYDILVSR